MGIPGRGIQLGPRGASGIAELLTSLSTNLGSLCGLLGQTSSQGSPVLRPMGVATVNVIQH